MNQIYKIAPLRHQLIGILERRAQVMREDKALSADALADASGKPVWAVEAAMASAKEDGLADQDEQYHWRLPALEAA